jgi:hypothetical protein
MAYSEYVFCHFSFDDFIICMLDSGIKGGILSFKYIDQEELPT